jgi:hypothetical protein
MAEPAGTKHMAIGLLLLVGGAGLSVWGHVSAPPGSRYVIFTGAILVGTIQFLYGVVKFLSTPQAPPVDDPFNNATADLRALVRAMVAAAEHSGRLDVMQVESIRSILGQVYGKDYDHITIANACRALWGEGDDVASHLFDLQAQLPLEFRRTIVRASSTVLGLQRTFAEGRHFLLYISRALHLPDEEFAENMKPL